MKEDLLHYIWKYKKYANVHLKTTAGKAISIKTVGMHNHLSGPDFFNASLEIDGQLWAGNVEIHMKSSDWYAHSHEKDTNYNNVILHVILQLLEASKNDWEKVLFILLFKNFGSKINGNHFFEIAKSLDFSVVRKLYNKPLALEGLFFGLAGLLTNENELDSYQKKLKASFDFLIHKHEISSDISRKAEFFKLRPSNFPTIRLSQFAALYASNNKLFQDLMHLEGEDLHALFNCKASNYWDTHYTFGKTSGKRAKTISKKFIDLLVINTIMPLKFCYQKHNGIPVIDSFTKDIARIAKEDNAIIQKFLDLDVTVKSAKDTQALLEFWFCTVSFFGFLA